MYAPTARHGVDVFGRPPCLTAHFPGHTDPDFALQDQLGSSLAVFPVERSLTFLLLFFLLQAGLFALPGLLGALGVYLFGRGEDQLFHEGAVAAEGVSFDAERCRVAAKRDVNPHAVLFPFEYERGHGVTRSVADQPEVEALQFRAEIQPVLFALHGLGLQSEVSGNISRSFGFALREEELPADVCRTVLLDQPFDDDRIIFVPQVRFVFSRMCIPIECFSLFGSEPENPERLSLDSV